MINDYLQKSLQLDVKSTQMGNSGMQKSTFWRRTAVAAAVAASLSGGISQAQVQFTPGGDVIPQSLPGGAQAGVGKGAPINLYPELEPRPGVYLIPPVVERPLKVDDGPKIKINAFDLRGSVDRPEKGLLVEDVQKIIGDYRSKHPDGFTIGHLQELANAITDHYRAKGFIVAYTYVPVQEVADGVITLQVLEGRLGQVLVEGNKDYDPGLLARPFDPLVGQPLTAAEVESGLVRLQDYPGLSAFGVFQPGKEVGDSDLVLKVQQEEFFTGKFSFNNHGSVNTGRYNGQLDFTVNNLMGFADKIDIKWAHSMKPYVSATYGVNYEQQFFEPQYRISVGYDKNDFAIVGQGLTNLNLAGLSESWKLSLKDNYKRGRAENAYWRLGLDRSSARTFQGNRTLAIDDITALTAEWGTDWLDVEDSAINVFSAQYVYGLPRFLGAMAPISLRSSRRGGNGANAGGEFEKTVLSYSRLQSLSKYDSWLFRANAQYSAAGKLLVPGQQFSMGGPNSVRAYSASHKLRDSGYFYSVEYIRNAPFIADDVSLFGNRKWGEVLQMNVFYDYAYGYLNNQLASEERYANLQGYGFGFQLNVPKEVSAKLSIAWPKGSDRPTETEPRTYFELGIPF